MDALGVPIAQRGTPYSADFASLIARVNCTLG